MRHRTTIMSLAASAIAFQAIYEHGTGDTLLQFLIDDEELKKLDARRQRDQQRFTFVMQALRSAIGRTAPP